MTAAEVMELADAAVERALALGLGSPDETRAAIRALSAAFDAVADAHRQILEDARALAATERADTAEVDAMLTTLAEMWGARFGGGDADVALDGPALFAAAWDDRPAPPPDPALGALDARAQALLDAWADRTEAWRALAALERRSLASLAALRDRQADLAARFAAAKVAAAAIPTLEAERDELAAVVRALAADPGAVRRPVLASARRRAGAALVVATNLHRAHGEIPGLGEHVAKLAEAFRILRDALAAA